MFFNGGRGDASSCFLFLLPVWKADDIAGAPGAILNHEVIEASTEDSWAWAEDGTMSHHTTPGLSASGLLLQETKKKKHLCYLSHCNLVFMLDVAKSDHNWSRWFSLIICLGAFLDIFSVPSKSPWWNSLSLPTLKKLVFLIYPYNRTLLSNKKVRTTEKWKNGNDS